MTWIFITSLLRGKINSNRLHLLFLNCKYTIINTRDFIVSGATEQKNAILIGVTMITDPILPPMQEQKLVQVSLEEAQAIFRCQMLRISF